MLLKEVERFDDPQSPQRQVDIDDLTADESVARTTRGTPWQRVLVARHPNRPTVLEYVNRLLTTSRDQRERRFEVIAPS